MWVTLCSKVDGSSTAPIKYHCMISKLAAQIRRYKQHIQPYQNSIGEYSQ